MIYKKDYTFILSEKIPEGRCGEYSITKEVLSKGLLLRTYFPGGLFYHDYLNARMPIVRLFKDDNIMMSDAPIEQEELRYPIVLARGRILVVGLGIGLFPTILRACNPTVKSVLIVEQSQDVVRLVYPHIKNRKTDIRVCDGKKFLLSCTEKFDFIYIDVWTGFAITLKEIDEWTELAKPCLAEGGEVRCWLQELYDRVKDKLPKEPIEPTSLAGLHEPCLVCGKKLRGDYAGLCMDCADDLEVSEKLIKKNSSGSTLNNKGIRR